MSEQYESILKELDSRLDKLEPKDDRPVKNAGQLSFSNQITAAREGQLPETNPILDELDRRLDAIDTSSPILDELDRRLDSIDPSTPTKKEKQEITETAQFINAGPLPTKPVEIAGEAAKAFLGAKSRRLARGFTQEEKPEGFALTKGAEQFLLEPERIPGSLEGIGQITGSLIGGAATGASPVGIAGGGILGGITAEGFRQMVGNGIDAMGGSTKAEEKPNLLDFKLGSSALRVTASELIGVGIGSIIASPVAKKIFGRGLEWASPSFQRTKLIKELADQSKELGVIKDAIKKNIAREKSLDPNVVEEFQKAIDQAKSHKQAVKSVLEVQGTLDKMRLGKPLTPFQQGVEDLENTYLQTLPLPRMLRWLDDRANVANPKLRDWNFKRSMGLHEVYEKAEDETGEVTKGFFAELQKRTGLTEIDDHLNVRLRMHSLSRQGGPATQYAEQIAEKYGLQKVLKAGPGKIERTILNLAEETFEKKVDQLARTYETITGKKFVRQEHYSGPVLFEDAPVRTLDEALFQMSRIHKPNLIARYQERVGDKELKVTEGFFDAFAQGIKQRERFINVSGYLHTLKSEVASDNYMTMMGQAAKKGKMLWRQVFDAIETNGNISVMTPFERFLRKRRINLQSAVLGFKFSSAAIQAGAIFDALSYAQVNLPRGASREILAAVTKTFVNPKFAKQVMDGAFGRSIRLRYTAGTMEQGFQEMLSSVGKRNTISAKIRRALTKFGFAPIREIDVRLAAGVQEGVENILKKYKTPNAKGEAAFVMNLINANSLPSFRPLILSQNEYLKTMLTFHTFVLNRWSIIAEDLIRRGAWKGIKTGDARLAFKALIGLGTIANGEAAEQIARAFIYEKTTGNKLPKTSYGQEIKWALPRQVPILGPMAEAAFTKQFRADLPPTGRLVKQTLQGVSKIIHADTGRDRLKGGMKALEGVLITEYGIEGTAQIFDLLEGAYGRPTAREKRIARIKAKRRKRRKGK